MVRRKKTSTATHSLPATAAGVAAADSDTSRQPLGECPPRLRRWVSGLVAVHFCALIISLSANLAPSYLQGQLTEYLAPYLVTSGQAFNAFPLELTHAEEFDFPVYVEARTDADRSERWEALPLPGIEHPTSQTPGWQFSRWTSFSRVVRLIITDQPESEIISDITAQLVARAEQQAGKRFGQVRWVAPHVPTYDEDALVARGEASLGQGALASRVIYTASVLHDVDGTIRLVPHQESLRTAKPAAVGNSAP